MDWKNKRTGEVVQVYERKRGSKIQLFAKTNDGQCLGRVMDSRYEKKGLIYIKNGCKFQNWKEGEKENLHLPIFIQAKPELIKRLLR